MTIAVSVLSRPNVDAAFTELVPPVVLSMAGTSLGFTPTLPTGSDALELRLRVQPVEMVTVMVGEYLDPAHPPQPSPLYDEDGTLIGQSPAPPSRVLSRIGVWGGQNRDIPFDRRESVLFRAVGA